MPDGSDRGPPGAPRLRDVLFDASFAVDGIRRLAPAAWGVAIAFAGAVAVATFVALARQSTGWLLAALVIVPLGLVLVLGLVRILLEAAWRVRRLGQRLADLEDEVAAVRRRVEDLPDASTVSVEVDAVEAVREALRQGAAGMDELRRRTGLPGAVLRGAVRALGGSVAPSERGYRLEEEP